MARFPGRKSAASSNEREAPESELADLIVAYLKQETIEPVKHVLRWVGYGVAGSIAICFGVTLVLLGILRLFQTAFGTTFTGSLNWLPYLFTLVFAAVIATSAAMAAKRRRR